MSKQKPKNLADYVEPLYMNRLQGRMLRLPAPANKTSEILFVYGHHASLERIFGFAEALNRYGAVTVPDLPGFGGMGSFYKIGMKPTLDNLADYLAAFIKLRYKHRRLKIIGMSFGFTVVTKMLQKHPDIAQKVDLLVSVVGFTHRDDFVFKHRTYLAMRYGASLFSNRLPAWIASRFFLRPAFIRATYHRVADKHTKLYDADDAERERRIDFEIGLWRSNDIRTYMDTLVSMLTLDLCTASVGLPVHHVAVIPDRYFDNAIVEQHMRIVFNDFNMVTSSMKGHAATVVATAKDVAPFFPRKIRTLLNS